MARKPPDTIAAIATAPGRGGIGVVRVSGTGLVPFAEALTGRTPVPRHATLADFRDHDGSAIDSGLQLYFPAPHSFTGEDVLELQGHGGPVVMQLLLARCVALGARLAEPGEFTRRAFENDKLDLAQAEAVADLIDAATASAARSAVRSLQGEFSKEIHSLVEQLTELRALTEATLDFPDEEVDFLESADAFGRLARLRERLLRVFERAEQGRLLRAMAEKEWLISADNLEQQFFDTITTLAARQREQRLEHLLRKARQSDLSSDEKEQLRELLTRQTSPAAPSSTGV